MRTVYYCLNGVGYFGSRSLRSIIELSPLLPTFKPPTRVRLFCIADPNEDRKVSAGEALRALDIDPKAVKFRNNLDEILSELRLQIDRGVGEKDLFLIHDCSPTSVHHQNVVRLKELLARTRVLGKHIRYLVEKPALTAVDFRDFEDEGIEFVLPDHCFCDYIELQSQTFLAAKDWLSKRSEFRPTRLFVWRNSGTGFKKVFEKGRAGVTGGALEDKAAHDIALTIALLGFPASEPSVVSANIENYMIGEWLGEDYERPSFATVKDSVTQVLDRRYSDRGEPAERHLAYDIADARIVTEVDWPLSDRLIRCRYSFSWDGVEPLVREMLDPLEVPQWIGREVRPSSGEAEEYTVEEARIHILEAELNGKSDRLILNFLTKFDKTEAWVAHVANGEKPEMVRVTKRHGGDNSLLRVLRSVVQESEPLFGRKATLLISKLIHAIRMKATEIPARDGEREAMTLTIEKFLDRSHFRRLPPKDGVIFDLDNTLLRTSDIPKSFVDPVIEAIASFRSRVQRKWKEDLRAALFRSAIDVVREQFSLSADEYKAATDAFSQLEIPPDMPLYLYLDAEEALQKLHEEGIQCALLTRGFRKLQNSKIKKLGLDRYFGDQIFVDSVEEGPGRPGQIAYLRRIAERWGCPPQRILMVGDDPDAELRAALELGMETVLVLRDPGIEMDEPHTVVQDLKEIVDMLIAD